MIVIKLKEAMLAYQRGTQEKITYQILADWTGIAHNTLSSIGGRPGYRTTMANLEKICIALDVTPGELLEIIPDKPRKPKRKKKTAKKTSRKRAAKKR